MGIASGADLIEFSFVVERFDFGEEFLGSEFSRAEGDKAFEEEGQKTDGKNGKSDHGDPAFLHLLKPIDLNKLGAEGVLDDRLIVNRRKTGVFGRGIGGSGVCIRFLSRECQNKSEQEEWQSKDWKPEHHKLGEGYRSHVVFIAVFLLPLLVSID